MTPAERTETERQVERALRRGELAEAVGLLEVLARAFPADAALGTRLAEVRGALQPDELLRPRVVPVHVVDEEHAGEAPSLAHEGERLFARGDFAGAAAAYRQALRERPDSELLRERLEELFELARAQAPVRPAAPPPGGEDARSRLEALLDRVATRRRSGPGQG